MSEYPTREMLMIGGAQLALSYLLFELGKEGTQSAREYAAEVQRVKAAVLLGSEVQTNGVAVKDCLAYAQQTLRVSHDEWERVIKVRFVFGGNT